MSEGNGTPPPANGGRDDGEGRDARTRAREAACCKRVTLPDGRYGFCIMPDGHEKPRRDPVTGQDLPPVSAICVAHVSSPPPPDTFEPKGKK